MTLFPEEPLNLAASEGFGYFPSFPGQKLNKEQYEITRKLGYGPRSSVWMALKPQNGHLYAIKILTVNETLQYPSFELNALNVAAKGAYINIYEHFTEDSVHGSHLCLVLDVSGRSYEHLRLSSPTKSLPQHVVQRAIACMTEEINKVHQCGLVHGAVTGSNIVFEIDTRREAIENSFAKIPPCTIEKKITAGDVEYPIVRSHHLPDDHEWNCSWDHINRQLLTLINFGHAQRIRGTPTWQTSRMDESLRPPEVILGLPYSSKVDTWMLGCATYHMLTGKPLVPEEKAKDDGVMLSWLIAMSGGAIPQDMVMKSKLKEEYFDANGSFKLGIPEETLESQISSSGVVLAEDIPGIVKFIQRCLTMDPKKRPSPVVLYKDEWTQPGFES